MKRIQEEQERLKRNRQRNYRKRKTHFEDKEGFDFEGLEKRVLSGKTLKEHWNILAEHTPLSTNIRVFEYAKVCRLLSEATLQSFSLELEDPDESLIRKKARKILDVLEGVWFDGITGDLEADKEVEYLVWVSLIDVVGVCEYRRMLTETPIPEKVRKRGLVGSTKPINQWFLKDMVMNLDFLTRKWPTCIRDGSTRAFLLDLRMSYAKLQNNMFGTDSQVLNYVAYHKRGVCEEETLETVNKTFDRIMNFTLRRMQLDTEEREAMRKRFFKIHKIPSLDKKMLANVCQWALLRSADASGGTANIVLKRVRQWYFHYFRRPGMEERYQETAYDVPMTIGRVEIELTLEGKLDQAMQTFSQIFPDEFNAFSSQYFECDTVFIVGMRDEEGFGKRVFELLLLLGFAHTFDLHTGDHWLESYFLDAPSYTKFSKRDEVARILIFRFGGEFYVVNTKEMHAYLCLDLPTALFTWINMRLPLIQNVTVQDKVALFREQIFQEGIYQLQAQEVHTNLYANTGLFTADTASTICTEFMDE